MLSVIDNGEIDGGRSKEDERGRFTKMRISGVVGPLDGWRKVVGMRTGVWGAASQ